MNFPPRFKIILGTEELALALKDFAITTHPDSEMRQEPVLKSVLQSIMSSVLTPIIDDTVSEVAYQQASFDLLDYHVPIKHSNYYAYDHEGLYLAIEAILTKKILLTLPQLTHCESKIRLIGFNIFHDDTLILQVTTEDETTSIDRPYTSEDKNASADEWDVLGLGRFHGIDSGLF